MKFTLKAYNDLGRCSYGTLKDEFDTERDVIMLNDYKVEVSKIEDLFPFLWQQPGASSRSKDGSYAVFHDHGTHWHQDFDESIANYDKEIQKLMKKLTNVRDRELQTLEESGKAYKLTLDIGDRIGRRNNLKRMLNRMDEEMEEQQKLLIKENQK